MPSILFLSKLPREEWDLFSDAFYKLVVKRAKSSLVSPKVKILTTPAGIPVGRRVSPGEPCAAATGGSP